MRKLFWGVLGFGLTATAALAGYMVLTDIPFPDYLEEDWWHNV
jgi:hypothetical protein